MSLLSLVRAFRLGSRRPPQTVPAAPATPSGIVLPGIAAPGTASAWDILNRDPAALDGPAGPAAAPQPVVTLPLPAEPHPPPNAAAPSQRSSVAMDSDCPIAVFGPDDLPQVASLGELARSLLATDGEDCTFRHAPAVPVDMVPGGMEVGRNLFGPGRCQDLFLHPAGLMRGVASSALHEAVVSGQSTSVQSRARGFFEPSVKLSVRHGSLAPVAANEPFYEADAEGEVRVRKARASLDLRDEIAVPICGVGFHNYGHFLYDGLPAALLYRTALPDLPIKLVGNEPAEWQRRLLGGLGLLDHYSVVRDPVCFTRVLTSDLLSLHVSYPTRFVRPVFDVLRFVLGGDGRRDRIVFLSRRADTARRVVSNRTEVEQALVAEGVEIVQPERLSVPEQVALAAGSRLIIGEGGAAMANVGFCDPGTAVLEIQHEAGPDGWTRAACRMMGLRWHLFVAAADHAGMAAHPEPKPHAVMTIDAPSLIQAVRTIRASL